MKGSNRYAAVREIAGNITPWGFAFDVVLIAVSTCIVSGGILWAFSTVGS